MKYRRGLRNLFGFIDQVIELRNHETDPAKVSEYDTAINKMVNDLKLMSKEV